MKIMTTRNLAAQAVIVFGVLNFSCAGTDANPAEGEKTFQKLGCAVCHTSKPDALGTDLRGLYGRKVELLGGRSTVVDDAFVTEHILDPRKSTRKGFQPVMPAFKGKVSDRELADLVSYVRSLSTQVVDNTSK